MSKFEPKNLIGLTLDDGWVIKSLVKGESVSGAPNYHYVAHNTNGTGGFVRVLSVELDALITNQDERLADLQLRIEKFRYEHELLKKCEQRNIKKVVKLIVDGTLELDGSQIPYFVFELAIGDIRSKCDEPEVLNTQENLYILHQTFTALESMHFNQITHQNIKPSIVQLFDDRTTKIGNLGYAHDRAVSRPDASTARCGDQGYAPLEQLYRHEAHYPEWEDRLIPADLYMLGSLIVYVFTGVNLTTLIQTHLLPEHAWLEWSGTYSDVLPFLIDAWEAALDDLESSIDPRVSEEARLLVRTLTNPDPLERGYSKRRTTGKYSLRPYVSRLDVLQKRLSIKDK